MKLHHGDRWSGLTVLAVAVYVAVEAGRLSFGTVNAPGPGFFPLLLSIALAGIAIGITGLSLAAFGPPMTVHFDKDAYRAILAFAAICATALVVERLGFVACAAVVMTVLLRWISKLSWASALLVAVAGVAAVYAVFTRLGVPLPKGLMPI